ncbi:MAG: hypothetical protein ACHQ1H_07465 [Nitrososphaerales archaeon]
MGTIERGGEIEKIAAAALMGLIHRSLWYAECKGFETESKEDLSVMINENSLFALKQFPNSDHVQTLLTGRTIAEKHAFNRT